MDFRKVTTHNFFNWPLLWGGLFVFFLISCEAPKNNHEIEFNGVITDDTVAKIIDEFEQGEKDTLSISSRGGYSMPSLKLGEYIQKNQIAVKFTGRCFSACAEFILPAASKRIFTKYSLFGFHGNNAIYYDLYHSQTSASKDYQSGCYYQIMLKEKELLEASGASTDFWKQVVNVIRPYNIKISNSPRRCSLSYDLEVDYWYPSPKQLSQFLNAELPDYICNARPKCAKRIINFHHKKGFRYVLGDDLYIVGGN